MTEEELVSNLGTIARSGSKVSTAQSVAFPLWCGQCGDTCTVVSLQCHRDLSVISVSVPILIEERLKCVLCPELQTGGRRAQSLSI
jgi:hypothetical protein